MRIKMTSNLHHVSIKEIKPLPKKAVDEDDVLSFFGLKVAVTVVSALGILMV